MPVSSLPFPSNTPPSNPLSTEENLQRIVLNLTAQHETVKHNMLVVARDRAKVLREAARLELEAVGDVEEPPPDPAVEEIKRKKVEEMIKKFRTKPPPGTNYADLEVKRPEPVTRKSRGSEYVIMGGLPQNQRRTPAVIRADLVLKLQRLIDDTVDDLADYDASSKHHIAHYQSLLEVEQRRAHPPGYGTSAPPVNTRVPGAGKRRVSFSANHSPSVNSPSERSHVQPVKGILRQGYTPSPKEIEALQKMRESDQIPLTAQEEAEERNERRRREEQQDLDDMKRRAMGDSARSKGMV